MSNYVSLHNHTVFSILDSLISPKDLFVRAKELGQKAVAITDHGTFASIWEAWKASKEVGVKLIVGCEFYFLNDVNKKDEKIRHVILLARNAVGYKNLLTLNRKGFDHSLFFNKKVYPIIDWELLKAYSEGVFCLTACGNGIVSQLLNNKKFAEAEGTVKKLKEIFGDYFGLEVQPNNLKKFSTAYNDNIDQNFTNYHLINLAKKLDIKIVPTSNAHYLTKEEAETHDVLLAIGAGQPTYSNARIKYDVHSFYLHSEEEIKSFFSRLNDEEEVAGWINNTSWIADQCEDPVWVDPKWSNPSGKELPVFPVKDEPDYEEFCVWLQNQTDEVKKLDEDKSYLRFVCEKDVYKRIPQDERKAEYEERLKEEFEVIEFHGFSSYMLIVADFIKWAKKNNILVGYGRGSAGGSLIAYVLGIHRADPIKYNLIFARFHNKEKTSFPDIDSDFAPSGRDAVKEYVRNKYGIEHVAHVSNINTITPKVYARDISRSCELGGSRKRAVEIGNAVADSIPASIKTIESSFEEAPLFMEYATKYPQFKKHKEISGKFRAFSTHAGGILIGKRPLIGLVPLRKDKDGAVAIEYNKDQAEENGLVKMDMLGSSTLDIVSYTEELISLSGKPAPLNQDNMTWDDPLAYDLISRGDTFGVFQFGTSAGTIDLCKKVKPKTLEDLSAINSLARPSAKDIREDFIKTKDGHKKVNLLHPSLQRAFGSTYGFGLYEECLFFIAQDVAGWSLHSADRLRKMTKDKGKNPKKIAALRQEFIDDAQKNKNISAAIATKIWDEIIANFAGYGFNASHSVLYSMLTYHTAYLKAHYPIEFLLANLRFEINSNTKSSKANIERIKLEIKNHNVKILSPNINRSELSYSLVDSSTLVTGLEGLKFVGEEPIQEILNKRPFKNFFDFMVRCNGSVVTAKVIQVLAATGCLDDFGLTRKQIYLYCADYRKKLQSWLKKNNPNTSEFQYPWIQEPDWSLSEKYALEKEYLGEAFVCGKKQAYAPFFDDTTQTTLKKAKALPEKTHLYIRGEIKSVFEIIVKKEGSKFLGQEMAKLVIEDYMGEQCSVTVFPERWREMKDKFKSASKGKVKAKMEEGYAIHFYGSVNLYNEEFGILVDKFFGFSSPPSLPTDLKAKKVSTRAGKKDKETEMPVEKDDIFEDLEEELFDEGLIDFSDVVEDD